MKIAIYTIGLLIAIAIGVGGWYLKREINAWLFYDGATQEVVCEMVKPEYLKEGACE